MSRIVVLTEYFDPKHEARRREIAKSIEVNCRIPETDEIVLFMNSGLKIPKEIQEALTKEQHKKIKVHWTRPNTRATYADFFGYCNEHLNGDICVVCNNDISFDESISLSKDIKFDNMFLCLTRWDVQRDNSILFKQPATRRRNSHDAWVFRSPLPENMVFDGYYYIGRPGCDGMTAYLAICNGMNVSNPSEIIRAKHLHLSNKRNYSQSDKLHDGNGILACVYPCNNLYYNSENILYQYPVAKNNVDYIGDSAIKTILKSKGHFREMWVRAVRRCVNV
tara:strand:+ start:66 stop:902 length:837 start_codon:yes stop_codon:yes gene_type:complete